MFNAQCSMFNKTKKMISPLAYIDPAAKIGKDVTIEPFAYIEGDVEIGDGCVIKAHASILKGTKMGQRNVVYHGAVIGSIPQDLHYKGEEAGVIIGDDCDIRENVVIARATHKGDFTTIGNHCFLMDGVHLCHDVKLDDWVILGVKASLAGCSHMESYSILSTGAVLQQHVHVGRWSFIQSGCRVAKDVPPYIIMAGNPAKYHGVNAQILKQNDKQPLDDRTIRHIMNAYYLIYQTSYSLEDATEKIIEQVPKGPQIDYIIDFVRTSKNLTK